KLNMQITIVNCIKNAWNMDYSRISDLLEKYDLLNYIAENYDMFNSMGIKGILADLQEYMTAMEGIA
ncbi:MAG: DUF3791 domain-containing protein, partial [Lachnospiraceae bacterium]|nr:DUF3791 domain-containing protein [Lachnospiraceae bacterium]